MTSDSPAGAGRKLTPEEEAVRRGGTEPPFSGKYWNEHAAGIYKCASCGAELFSSDAKFDSGTGWPSFTSPSLISQSKTKEGKPAKFINIELRPDYSFGMRRTEVLCRKCGAHLGHLFDDGPADKGGQRYCINSVCLDLEKKEGA